MVHDISLTEADKKAPLLFSRKYHYHLSQQVLFQYNFISDGATCKGKKANCLVKAKLQMFMYLKLASCCFV